MNFSKILSYFSLKNELESYEELNEKIESGVVFKGTNLWILVFAIFLASLGLNVNSPAVIIGAMLVSPLMGPIMGIGFSMGTYNFLLLKKSANNFGFAIITALITSTIFFIFSPIHEAHSELLARTKPNFYDVLIALFGGLAGIFGTASRQKGNVLPGVAIATALMPPLCTAGYGLSDLNPEIFFGALFLFTINTVFIAWATYLGTRFFKTPLFQYPEIEREKKAKSYMYSLLLLTLIPSIYFAYDAVQKNNFKQNATRFVNELNVSNGTFLIKHTIDENGKSIELTFAGAGIDSLYKTTLQERLNVYKLKDAKLTVSQSMNFLDANKGNKSIQDLNATIASLRAEMTLLQESMRKLQAQSMKDSSGNHAQ